MVQFQKDKINLALVSIQFQNVTSGPGTFTQYLYQYLKDNDHYNFLIFTEDVEHDCGDERIIKVNLSPNELWRYKTFKGKSYLTTIDGYINQIKDFTILFNTSPVVAYQFAKKYPNKANLMISDYNNVVFSGDFKKNSLGKSIKKSILQVYEKKALKNARKIITNSQFLGEIISEAYQIPLGQFECLYKAVDLAVFRPKQEETINIQLTSKKTIQILFVKSDYLTGGLPALISALKQLENDKIQLSIVGPKEKDFENIRMLSQQLDFHNIKLLGRKSREELKEIYLRHDILCVPSKREALGVVFLEGQSVGISVIGSNVGGISEVLDKGESGWLVEAGNSAGLSDTLKEVIQNDKLRISKIKHGWKHVRQFSKQRMFANFDGLMESLASV